MNVYPIILLNLNQALVCSASLSAHPVGSDDLSDRIRHRRAYRRPWWSCAALHSQSALNFLAGHQIHLKRKASYDKRGKVWERRKRWHSWYWRFATHSSIQELQPSTVMWHTLRRLGADLGRLYRESHVPSALSKLLLSKSVWLYCMGNTLWQWNPNC